MLLYLLLDFNMFKSLKWNSSISFFGIEHN